MGAFISFGRYNNLYKYIWIVVILKTAIDFLFSPVFPETLKPEIFYSINYPPGILVHEFFIYLGTFLFTIVIIIYQIIQNNSEEKKIKFPKIPTDTITYKLLHYDINKEVKNSSIIKISFLSIISFEILNTIMCLGLDGVVYWVFDLLFIAYINLLIFQIPIYDHKKCAIAFIIIFATLFKLLATFEILYNDKYDAIYKRHIIFIPIIAIIYLVFSLLRFYSLCKIKWLLDFKYVSLSKFLIIYTSIGMFVLLIACIISSNIKCADPSKFTGTLFLCSIQIKNGNKADYYFDKFSYFFETLWRKDKSIGMNFLYLILFIIRLILNAFRLLYSILIVKNLNPEYYQCTFQIYYFFILLIVLIKSIIEGEDATLHIYNIFAEISSIIGILIYLELIELKFCKLNENLRNNIQSRSFEESDLNNLLKDSESEVSRSSTLKPSSLLA